ncbi:MAG: recombinase family protein, partial [Eubacteriales bacterium]|nr:recombinase family protein [Eubacteriales bacterium]
MEIIVNNPKEIASYYDENRELNVCAYCRVSTNDKDQRNSFKAQKEFFEAEFKLHNNWKKKTIFADEGISGTSLNKRDNFNKMISLAKKKQFDFIITKEVSRFSRNIQDLLNIVEDLRKIDVFVYFMSDDINTQNSDYRAKLIEAGEQAEAESRKTSKRVKWGQQQKMKQGFALGRREMLGYNIVKVDDDTQRFDIIPEEAEIVKLIFKTYATSNKGTFQIARMLEQKGYKTKRFKNGWSNTVILRILRNEKYVGDLALGKTFTPNFLDHKKKYNRGESASYYIKNHHTGIISRQTWNKVQAKLKENEPSDEIKAKHSNRFWCSGKIFCGICGQRFVSHNKKLKALDE